MRDLKYKLVTILMVAVVGFGCFGILTNLASRMFIDVKEYVPYALTVVTLFFIKECYQILKEKPIEIS
jgi:exosortase/archaeosortase